MRLCVYLKGGVERTHTHSYILFLINFLSFLLLLLAFRMTFIKFSTPTTIGVYGSQQSGKTCFVKRLLENYELFSEVPNKILYCYNVNQPLYEDMEKSIPHFLLKKG